MEDGRPRQLVCAEFESRLFAASSLGVTPNCFLKANEKCDKFSKPKSMQISIAIHKLLNVDLFWNAEIEK